MPDPYFLPPRLREQVSEMEESMPGVHVVDAVLEDGAVAESVMVFNGVMLHSEDCDGFNATDIKRLK